MGSVIKISVRKTWLLAKTQGVCFQWQTSQGLHPADRLCDIKKQITHESHWNLKHNTYM